MTACKSHSRWCASGLLLAALIPSFAARASSPSEAPAPTASAAFHAVDAQMAGLMVTLLEANPRLLAARRSTAALGERAAQAGSLPDPQLLYRYFPRSPETRVGPQEHGLEISQGVPWRGKRELDASRATHVAGSSNWRLHDLERILVAELKRVYYESAYLQEALAINREERELLRRFEKIALKRYSTGVGIQQSAIKVQTDISRSLDQDAALSQRLAVNSRRLAQFTSRPQASLDLEPIFLSIPDLDIDAAMLEEQAVLAHPGVRAAEEQIAADLAWSTRRSLDSRPDFRFGVGYTLVDERQDGAGLLMPPENNGKDILGITVGLNIPLQRRRIAAGIAEARESMAASESHLAALQDEVRFRIQQAVLRLRSLAERGSLHREVLIPQAGEALASAEAAYSTDRLGFLDLLDAERVLFQVRQMSYQIVSDYWIQMAELELALGSPFPSQVSP